MYMHALKIKRITTLTDTLNYKIENKNLGIQLHNT